MAELIERGSDLVIEDWSEEAREAVAAELEQLARRLRTESVHGAWVFHRDAWSVDVEVRFRPPGEQEKGIPLAAVPRGTSK
jgi:hypothetical protein